MVRTGEKSGTGKFASAIPVKKYNPERNEKMKQTKKLVSFLLALVMILSMTVTVFAAGETGSITINKSSTVPVEGKTFNAYRILDVQPVGDGYVYTVPAKLKSFYTSRYSLNGNEGNFDYQVAQKISEETDMFAFATDALAAAKAAGITPGTAAAAEGADSVTIDNLALGYYVVEDVGAATPISALILDTIDKDVAINIKADKPSIDKKIDGTKDTDDTTTGDVENNNAAIGDKVPYKVTSKVPDMTGYTKYYFVVNDTLSKGLTFNDDVAITIGTKTLVKGTDYTVTSTENDKDGTTAVKIVFKNFIQYAAETYKNADITITYSATVNEDAVIGTAGNPNEVTLVYSHNPNIKPGDGDEPGPDFPVGETPKSITRTFVTGIELEKVDPQGKKLTGAEFKIEGTKLNQVLISKEEFIEDESGEYWKLKDDSYTKTAPTITNDNRDNSAEYDSTTTKYKKTNKKEIAKTKENVEATGFVDENGILTFEGLSAGTYKITELTAPNGYNLLKKSIELTITFTAPENSSAECTWTYSWKVEGKDVNNNSATIRVVNEAGTELPSTGGTGTTIFYVLGFVLMAGAAVLLITRRRMNAEK